MIRPATFSVLGRKVVMFEGIATVANGVVHHSLNVYYATATHRLIEMATDSTPLPERPVVFFRSMMHFEPAAPYLETLRAGGLAPAIFRFGAGAEKDHFRQWRENTVDAVRELIAHPEVLERRPIFVGHSAGGFSVYVLAALSKGARLAGLQEVLPGLRDIPEGDLRTLADRLRRGLFITIGAPLNGVQLTRLGRLANRWIVEPRVPLLFSGITRPNVEEVYRKLGVRPKEVMDGNIVAIDRPLGHGGQGSLASWAGHIVVQGGMRLFSPFLDHNTVNDGIVPLNAAFLEGVPQILLSMDHLKLVETPEAAQALLRLISWIEQEKSVLPLAS